MPKRNNPKKYKFLTPDDLAKIPPAPVGQRACDVPLTPKEIEQVRKEVELRAEAARAVLPPESQHAPFHTDTVADAIQTWTELPASEYGRMSVERAYTRLRYAAARKHEKIEENKQAVREAVKEALARTIPSAEYGPFTTAECREAWGVCEETWRNWYKGKACPKGLAIRKLSRGRWMLNQKLPQRTPTKQKA